MENQLVGLLGRLSISRKDDWFQQPKIIPYEGIKGCWVQAKNFQSKRNTFGYYRCNYCQKNWMSAFSKKNYKQGCKNCKRYFYAGYLWENHYNDYQEKREKKPLHDNQKPHIKSLCEACRKGVCKQSVFIH